MSRAKIYRAGVIPYYKCEDTHQIMIYTMKPADPKYGGNCFQLAKGKIEDGETTEEAALRESNEELGLYRHNLEFIEEVGVFLGRTTFYIGKVKDKELFGLPHFETSETKWLTEEGFINTGRKLHIPVVKAVFRLIGSLEQG